MQGVASARPREDGISRPNDSPPAAITVSATGGYVRDERHSVIVGTKSAALDNKEVVGGYRDWGKRIGRASAVAGVTAVCQTHRRSRGRDCGDRL